MPFVRSELSPFVLAVAVSLDHRLGCLSAAIWIRAEFVGVVVFVVDFDCWHIGSLCKNPTAL